jgi:hypothetical protein
VVNSFIRRKAEKNIKKFFLDDIDNLLMHYEPGRPNMKPDALKQIKEIEEKREVMIKNAQEQQKQNAPIVLNRPGQEPVTLNSQQIIEVIQNQRKRIEELNEQVSKLERFNQLLQTKIIESRKEQPVQTTIATNEDNVKIYQTEIKSRPELIVNIHE